MDIDKKLKDVLSGVTPEQLKKSKSSIQQFLNTPEGKKIASEIGAIDKNKLIGAFMSMDTQELKQKLKNVDLSKLSNTDAKSVINKLK